MARRLWLADGPAGRPGGYPGTARLSVSSTIFNTGRAGTLSLNAQVLAQTQRLIARLQSALEARAVIDQAIGILMSRSGGTEVDARVWLRSLSQDEDHKLVVIARQIIDDAVRRGPPPPQRLT
jgi:hypothetical protein